MLDLKNEFVHGMTFTPAVRTTTANGSGIDLLNAGPELCAEVAVGVMGGTTPTLDITLEESADNTTFTAMPGTPAFTQMVTGTQLVQLLNITRTKRYVRGVATFGGTSPSWPFSMTIAAKKNSY